MIRSTRTVVFLLGITLLAATGAQAWQDGQFVDEDWELVPWVSPLDSGGSNADVAFTIGHGGNPGALRAIGVGVGTAPDDGAMAVQFFRTASWTPGVDGDVLAIDGSLDFSVTNDGPTRAGLVIEQAGTLYMHTLVMAADHFEWITYDGDDLAAADFEPIDPDLTGHPEFGAGGGPMRFGFATGQFADSAAGHELFTHSVDNWRMIVDAGPMSSTHATPPPVVPAIHPNPFNPVTEIAFELPAPGFVTLRIHDLAGRVVRTLEARHLDSGHHAVVWRGKNATGDAVASGVYLAVLGTARGQASRRLTLVR